VDQKCLVYELVSYLVSNRKKISFSKPTGSGNSGFSQDRQSCGLEPELISEFPAGIEWITAVYEVKGLWSGDARESEAGNPRQKPSLVSSLAMITTLRLGNCSNR
jgi:hypothetical protein